MNYVFIGITLGKFENLSLIQIYRNYCVCMWFIICEGDIRYNVGPFADAAMLAQYFLVHLALIYTFYSQILKPM